MATTESRTGFRLPWSSEERSDKAPVSGTAEATTTDEATDAVTAATSAASEATEEATLATAEATVADASTEGQAEAISTGESTESTETDPSTVSESSPKEASVESTATAAPAPSRPTSAASVAKKPTKFVLDLSRAMQAAAEESRAQTLGQFQADAKTFIENIHSRSAGEATDLRKRSDDDIAAIQDWSKTEIARIREATQGKIAERKMGLERELEEHAGQIEYEIDRVQSRVAGFELEMERFFEQLVAEEDPTQIAVMAQTLPDPPSFDASVPWRPSAAIAELIGDTPIAVAASPALAETTEGPAGETDAPGGDAVMSAIEATHLTAETAEADATTTGDETAQGDATTDENDPRLAALGLSPNFDAAEAEAAAEATSADDEIPTIGDDALAARLAGLVPAEGEVEARPARAASEQTSKVIVSGLISVASIASFKRHLGRVTGVQSVGVSSGPDGEFVFTVHHDDAVNLREVVPALPGFRARVTNAEAGVVSVTAHDPESGN
jgi:hypothetical protein